MKKLVFVINIIFLLGSCKLIPSDTTIVNNSSYPVSFQYSYEDKKIIKLAPNTSTSTKYFHAGIVILQPEKRVGQNRDSDVITISDLTPWEVRVENKTGDTIKLTAGGWMDEMIVPKGAFVDDNDHKGNVYTKTPSFEAKSDEAKSDAFPLNLQWQFVDNIFYVVIKD